jgi:ribonuclease E
MHSPVVQLRSGGYIVINPTEALVAIDVNSGRSTKERNIEETALRTNLEAAEEVARQVRLRDLAGLIVIDFIDMEEHRHQRQVEHKVKDAMRNDRARIQIGRISAFGLMELSRQRLRPSLLEHSTEICPHCAGTGRVRSIESAALHALRAIEEEGVRRRSSEIVVSVPPNVALYLLNQKRHALSEIEQRYAFHVTIEADDELHAADCEIERVRQRRDERPAQELARATYDQVEGEGEPAGSAEADGEDRAEGERERAAGEEEGDRGGRRRRRRRRRGRRDGEDRPSDEGSGGDDRPYAAAANGHDAPSDEPSAAEGAMEPEGESFASEEEGEGAPAEAREGQAGQEGDQGDRRRRRGRRGGRRRRGREDGEGERSERSNGWNGEEQPAAASIDGQPAAPLDGQPVEQMPGGHMPVEHQPFAPAMTADSAPPPPPSIAPAIAPSPEPVVAQAPQPAPEPAEVRAEPPPSVVVPTISADAPPEKPKRGWWRR